MTRYQVQIRDPKVGTMLGFVSFGILILVVLLSVLNKFSEFTTPLFGLFFVFSILSPYIHSRFSEKGEIWIENNTLVIKGKEEQRIPLTEGLTTFTISRKSSAGAAIGIRPDGEKNIIFQFNQAKDKIDFMKDLTNAKHKVHPWTKEQKTEANRIEPASAVDNEHEMKNLDLSSLGDALGRFRQMQGKTSEDAPQPTPGQFTPPTSGIEEDHTVLRVIVVVILAVVVYGVFRLFFQ